MLQVIRKGKLNKRVMAWTMALLMVVGLLPIGLLSGAMTVNAEEGEHSFDAATILSADENYAGDSKKKAAIADGYKLGDFFTVVGEGTIRSNSSTYSIELAKDAGSGIQFTITGTGNLTFDASSTGSSNSSAVGLIDAKGNVITEDNGITTVQGSSKVTLSYTGLEAGTYKIVSTVTDDDTLNRGVRVYSAKIVEVPGSVTTEYAFSAETILSADENYAGDSKKKAAIADGYKLGDFFTVVGEGTIRSNSSTYSIELAKDAGSGIQFTITGTGNLTFDASSTGSSNSSAVGLIDAKGNVITEDNGITTVQGSSKVTLSYTGLEAGTYKIVSTVTDDDALNRGVRVYSAKVTETTGGERPARKDWAKVAAPTLGTPALKEGADGTIVISYTMNIGYDGADSVTIIVKDKDGKELKTLKSSVEGTEGKVEYSPSESGTYVFSIKAIRENEEDKAGTETVSFDFKLPLATPFLKSATSAGDGKINVVWNAVKEAEQYEVFCNGTSVGKTDKTEFMVTGLTVGTKYTFAVLAIRGEDKTGKSAEVTVSATKDAKKVWEFAAFGTSTNKDNNKFENSINEDGKVTVWSEGGKGKIVSNSTDGIAFYYTAIPTTLNFTLRAKVTVDSWTLSNGQEGFGLLAADRVGTHGDSTSFWNNSYMALASKVEYTANKNKYSMKLGLGVIERIGATKDNLPLLEKGDTSTIQNQFSSITTTLDNTPEKLGLSAGTYNLFGNATKSVDGTVDNAITEVILEIQKNNTGYFVTYYDTNGDVIKTIKYYDPEALNKLDSENVYVGFFAARNARATFSDVVLTTIDPKDDAPAEEKPVTKVEPTLTVQSADVANTKDYTLSLIANVAGTAVVKMGDKVIASDLVLKANERLDKEIVLPNASANELVVEFTPDPDQDLGEDTILANTNKVTVNKTVTRSTKFERLNNIYVSPNGTPDAKGTKGNPVDIYTAVKFVQPGQTIIILEGTYLLSSTVRVERGIDGTAEANIRMIADPNAKTRPVFDFQGKCAGMVLGGDYWYFKGFDVTKSANAQKGIQVSGSNNVLDSINAYYNGNTGIQISRLFSTDTFNDWPANNLILNCTSYGNADAGYEDADGFAAKLTVGEGNVFDGCVAHHNADDGWDLYAKVETGAIGAVTIQNCVAYSNGYLEDGTNAGNGNGFKMGGESLSGKHVLKNSYAFFNKAKGIDSNSCPDIIVYNSISFNNESYNVAFYTNNAANTAFKATGIISFKDEKIKSGFDIGENYKPKGTQNDNDVNNETNYFWNGSQSANNKGAKADATWFKSLTFTGITRNADGTINMNGFLELTDKVPTGIGAVPGGTASKTSEIPSDKKEELVNKVEVTDKTTVDDILTAVDAVIDSANASGKDVVPVVELEVKDNTTIATELIQGIKGEEVVIRVELENGIVWDIYGKDVTDNAAAVDLNVTVNGNKIPASKVDKVEKLGTVVELSIAHDGQFGFGATMKYAVGEAANGKYATLYWYNDGKFEKIGSYIVEDGCVEFVFTHASDYVVVLADAEIADEVIKTGDISSMPMAVIFVFGLVLIAGVVFFKRRYVK